MHIIVFMFCDLVIKSSFKELASMKLKPFCHVYKVMAV